MKISLLYGDPNKKPQPMAGAEQTVYDLSLDRLVAQLCQGEGRADALLRALKTPLTSAEDIVYRQHILQDLDSDRELLRSLSTLLTRYDKIKSDWVELRSGVAHISSAGAEARLECACASLKITAVFPRSLASFFGGIAELLDRPTLHSEGLTALRELCRSLVDDSSLGEIVEISDSFRYGEPSERSYRADIAVTPELEVGLCGIVSSEVCDNEREREAQRKKYLKRLRELDALRARKQSLDAKSGTLSKLLGSLFSPAVRSDTSGKNGSGDERGTAEHGNMKQNSEGRAAGESVDGHSTKRQDDGHGTKDGTLPLPESARDDISTLLAAATEDIDRALTAVTDSIYSMLYGLGAELRFYEGALALMDSVRAGSLPLVYPEITESDCRCTALRDMYLLCEGKSGDGIIPNDLELSGDIYGMIVRGGNGTGKTVFLRSVGTAQLIAQAGLPICADSARVAIRRGVYTHFSSAEEDFTAGDTAGRFEGEVRAVSAIMDVLTDGSLLLLNETFQTTAYAEGADAMAGILSVLPELGTKYIFVTHLGDIGDIDRDGHVKLMKTLITAPDGSTEGKKYVLS